MADWAERKQVGAYIGALRRKRGFRLGQVSEGLCTEQMLYYLEKGERAAPRLLQDALLERLGIGAEDYENYMHYKEYGRWMARQRILHCITYEDTARARQLLEQYRITYTGHGKVVNVSDRLEKQFCLSMLVQIRRHEGAGREELLSLSGQAAGLTVQVRRHRPLKEMALSIKELNLLLEEEHYREGGGSLGHYRELLAYIEAAGFDGVGMAKLYPKAVYFLCMRLGREGTSGNREFQKAGGQEPALTMERLLTYCNRAVECLRNNSRMYYLWELLEIRGKILGRMAGRLSRKGETEKARLLERARQENDNWKETIESVYAEFDIPKETFSYTYLYVEKGAACISDVIRIRRGMLGMSREALCDGICDIKTLGRLENRKTEVHREIVEELFERLGLSREMTRTELVTEKQEARQLMEKLRVSINNHRLEETEALLARIKGLVPGEIRCNRQVLTQLEISLKKNRGEMDKAEYFNELRMALEITLPYEALLKDVGKYLTYEEQRCIYNMMRGMDKRSGEFLKCMKCFEAIYSVYEETELIETVSGMYEFIMGYVGSEWGNLGDFERSDRYAGIILVECLRSRRMHSIAAGLYDRWWNYAERKRRGLPADILLSGEKELTRCLVFSILDRQKYYEPFYQKELEKERKMSYC